MGEGPGTPERGMLKGHDFFRRGEYAKAPLFFQGPSAFLLWRWLRLMRQIVDLQSFVVTGEAI
jgi:hypothetical protein